VAAHASTIIGPPLCGSRLSSRRREWRVRALSSKQNFTTEKRSKNDDLAMLSQNDSAVLSGPVYSEAGA